MAKDKKPGKSRKGRTASSSAGDFRSFSSDSYGVEVWGDEHFMRYLQDLPSNERDGLTVYTGSAYSPMNAHLRGYITGNISEKNHKAIDNATAALDKASLPEAVVLHRGMDAFGAFSNLDTLQVGSKFTDEGFGSTSPDPSKAWSKQIHMEIRAPKGTKAAWVKPVSSHPNEREVMIQRNTTYKIVSVDPANGKVVVQIVAQKKAKNPAPYTAKQS